MKRVPQVLYEIDCREKRAPTHYHFKQTRKVGTGARREFYSETKNSRRRRRGGPFYLIEALRGEKTEEKGVEAQKDKKARRRIKTLQRWLDEEEFPKRSSACIQQAGGSGRTRAESNTPEQRRVKKLNGGTRLRERSS